VVPGGLSLSALRCVDRLEEVLLVVAHVHLVRRLLAAAPGREVRGHAGAEEDGRVDDGPLGTRQHGGLRVVEQLVRLVPIDVVEVARLDGQQACVDATDSAVHVERHVPVVDDIPPDQLPGSHAVDAADDQPTERMLALEVLLVGGDGFRTELLEVLLDSVDLGTVHVLCTEDQVGRDVARLHHVLVVQAEVLEAHGHEKRQDGGTDASAADHRDDGVDRVTVEDP